MGDPVIPSRLFLQRYSAEGFYYHLCRAELGSIGMAKCKGRSKTHETWSSDKYQPLSDWHLKSWERELLQCERYEGK